MTTANAVAWVWLSALAGPAWPQGAGAFAGLWVGTMATRPGGEIQVELRLRDAGGTWRMSDPARPARAKQNPCLERDLPLIVVAQKATQLALDVQGAQVIQGCVVPTATLTSPDDQTLRVASPTGAR